jgi:hypothetical protein
MATKIIFDKDQSTAFIKRTGYIKPGEMLEGFKKLESSPFFGDLKKSLADATAADFADIPTKEFEVYGSYCGTRLKNLKIAIVVSSDLSFGLARIFGTITNADNTQVFRTMEGALSWLDVKLPEDFHD